MAISQRDGRDVFASERPHDEEGSMFEQLDLQHYLRTLRKHKWAIFTFSALITILAAYYAATATPIYRSTSTLLIESQGGNLVQFEELIGLDTENQDYYQTQFELLRSRGLAVRVIEHMDLWDSPELSNVPEKGNQPAATLEGAGEGSFPSMLVSLKSLLGLESDQGDGGTVVIDLSGTPDQPDLSALQEGSPDFESLRATTMQLDLDTVLASEQSLTVERQKIINLFMSRLVIEPVRKTKLVRISFTSADPVFAAKVANTVGEQYIESYLDAKLELTTKAASWLNERLGDLKSVLEGSEDRLISFKESNGLVDVDGSVGRLNEQELLLATAELAQARSALASQADLYREVQNIGGNSTLLESIPAIQADPLVQRVKIEQGQAQRLLDELRNRYGERHPRVVDAKSQLVTLNSTLQGHLVRVAGSISKDFQLARQRVASIESKLASGKQEIQALGTKKFELDELEREVQTNREIYNTFYSRITEASSADGLESANARISDAAVPAIRPFKPKKGLIVGLAALVSLILSALMAVLYEQMDDTVKSTSDIEFKLGLNLLGILPLVKSGFFSKTRELPLNPLEIPDKKGRFAEAVNTTRTAICLEDGKKPRKVIAITSSIPGEGKSSTSINIAHSLGQLERVLLIDCDLRRPTVAKAAGLDKNTPGLTNLITKTAPASECIKQGMFGGVVDVLPSGPIPEQPLELLSSRRFEKIVAQLSEHYDRIIFDCPPTQAVSDALAVSKLTDAVIYCVKSHETSLDLVRRGIQRMKQVGAPIAGIIVTMVDIDKITNYGGDYYYQGYYDYYGYTEKGATNKGGGKLRLTKDELHEIRSEDDDMRLDLNYMSSSHTIGSQTQSNEYEDYDQTAQFDFADNSRMINPTKADAASGNHKAERGEQKSKRMRGDLDII